MTPEDKALCEALRLDYLNPEALEAAGRIEALALAVETGMAALEAGNRDNAALRAENERLKEDIAAWPVCDEHKPGQWDGGTRCVVCEAHEEHAEVERLKAERDRWLKLFNASEQFQSGPTVRADRAEVERDALRAVLVGLRPIAESMRGQDNRATSHPVYVVETKTGRMGGYEFVTAFFSEAGADAYVASNAHNLKKPRIYVYSAHRNREWQAVRAWLLSLLNEHGVTPTNEVETC